MPLQFARIQARLKSTRFWLIVCSMTVFAAVLPERAGGQESNNVVAVANAEPITRKTLADESVKRYGQDVLDNMVNRQLIMQECVNRGVEVTNQEVSDEIRRLAAKFGLSLESYLQLLQEERDITPGQYSREIVWPMLALRRLVSDKVKVGEDEFNRAYVAQFGEAVKCRLIMVAERARAVELQQEAKAAPEQFANFAKKFSEDEASASVGGLIPPIRRYSGDTRLEDAAFALQTGDVSDVLQLGDQWIFLQAVRRIPSSKPSPQALPAIREQINDRIRDEKMRGASAELFTGLQREAKVIKVLGNPELSKQYPGIAAVINGEKLMVSLVAGECIKRHGPQVLDGEINRTLLRQALRSAKKQVTQQDLQAEVASAAIRYGYLTADGQADVKSWLGSVTASGETTEQVYVADAVWPSVALSKLVEDQVVLSEADLEKGFASAYGPRVEVLAVVLSDQRSAQKLWEMARDNPTDEFFGRLAEQYSVEPVSSSNLGKVPPIRKHGGQPAIEKEAFGLKPGELSGIIATGGKYLILRCQGFTKPVVTDPAVVREELVRDLTEKTRNKAMADRFEKIIDESEVDNFLEVAKTPKVATRP
jgi:parvulin-like peptidyl-prolyl isomerase